MSKFNKLKIMMTLLLVVVVLTGCVSQEILETTITFAGSFLKENIVYHVAYLIYNLKIFLYVLIIKFLK